MDVCSSCGSVAPKAKDSCWRCNELPYPEPRLSVEAAGDGLLYAHMRGDFDCRSCGHKVALNHFSLDGYLCGSCGIEQRFDWSLWEDIITHAHNTADLTGFNKPGVLDEPFWKALAHEEGEDIARMYRSIGETKSTLTKGNSSFGGLEFEMDVSPGRPVCQSCSQPLSVTEDQGSLKVACGSCGNTTLHSPWGQSQKYGGVVGIISHENRTDSPDVHTDAAQGGVALAISCPKCNGALDVEKVGEVVVCPYCSTTCHVPERVLQRATGKPIPKEDWWILFRGKSPQRSLVDDRLTQEQGMAQSRERMKDVRRAQEAERAEHLHMVQTAHVERRNQILIALLIAAGAGFLIWLNLS